MTNQEKRFLGNPRVVAQIQIKLLQTGQVEVTGPLGLTTMCEQMINEAFKVLQTFKAGSETDEQGADAAIVVPKTKIVFAS